MDFIRLSTCSMIFMFNLAITCMRVCEFVIKNECLCIEKSWAMTSCVILGHLSFRYVKRLLKTY